MITSRFVLPPVVNYQKMGLFCKLDWQLERGLRFPVIIRLGDALQVEGWEGKGPWASPERHELR